MTVKEKQYFHSLKLPKILITDHLTKRKIYKLIIWVFSDDILFNDFYNYLVAPGENLLL